MRAGNEQLPASVRWLGKNEFFALTQMGRRYDRPGVESTGPLEAEIRAIRPLAGRQSPSPCATARAPTCFSGSSSLADAARSTNGSGPRRSGSTSKRVRAPLSTSPPSLALAAARRSDPVDHDACGLPRGSRRSTLRRSVHLHSKRDKAAHVDNPLT